MDTWVGNISCSCISMATDDFYASHRNYTTRLDFYIRNSKEDVVSAASAALDLLINNRVEAIIGPQTSIQAKFVAELGNRTHIPIISFSATSPVLSSVRTPYFIRTTISDSSQAQAIAALVRSFGWSQLVPIFEDTDYGTGMIPYLIDAFQTTNARVPHRSMIPLSANDDQILTELYFLMTLQTRVFVVHASYSLVSRLLTKAKEIGMMKEGYAWIVTYGLTDNFGVMDSSTLKAMHGVLTVNPYVPQYLDFNTKWRARHRRENPAAYAKKIEPSVYAMWAYDTVWALAFAAEAVSTPVGTILHDRKLMDSYRKNSTNLEELKLSPSGHKLLDSILGMDFDGVTGRFRLVNGQLEAKSFEIININRDKMKKIGYWTSEHGISGKLDHGTNLEGVIWPGDAITAPNGLDWQSNNKTLRIGVPVMKGFMEFVNREWNPLTNRNGSGFCIEVFDTIMASLPYKIPYEYIPFEDDKGKMNGTYNDLVYQVYLGNFDAVVGDVTITPNRSLYVDFSVAYTELGMAMVVPIKDDRGKSPWIFLKPLTTDLWLASGAFFVFTGFAIWVLEHRINEGFRGHALHQLGTIFYFSFSTLVFAHREKVLSNFTRVVVIIWLFVVLILTSSYTASLTSMLTVQQLHPTATSLHEIIRNGEYIGYMGDSGMLRLLNIDASKLKAFDSAEAYDEALSKGSARGGVSAIIDEIPYIKVFLSKYCGKYTMVGTIYRTDGFGFAFQKGSPLVSEVSRTILKATEEIDKKLYRNKTACPDQNNMASSNSLTLDSFRGLFLLSGITTSMAIISSLLVFLLRNRQVLTEMDSESSMLRRLITFVKLFDQKDESFHGGKKGDLKELSMKAGSDGGPSVWPHKNGGPANPWRPTRMSNKLQCAWFEFDNGTKLGQHFRVRRTLNKTRVEVIRHVSLNS
ncbi:glutamate receptor ionotropic plant protein [Dioscorea alata]|uniref:Glutamate receptor ionotropic plant protein n=1 Tax=Dioscorea alata TaxID=55571 RepID=A0ACB7UNN3_DIOAL|nr:glutamate receptor ionotropic plant protein [Dioscorea alata]